MKHAYLILAHNQWALLQTLVACLDDRRNDIYVHLDRKVTELPELHCNNAGLHLIRDRVDVHWGDVSVVQAEYALFEEALRNGGYDYFHLLSGVDLPLKSMDETDAFFERHAGKEFIGYTLTESTPELVRKVQRYHLFPEDFRNKNPLKSILRSLFLKMQEVLGIKRNRGVDFKKGSQWVSVSAEMARIFVAHKDWALKTFRHCFCPDEIVMQTLCWNSPRRTHIYNTTDDAAGCLRAIGWHDGRLDDWKREDLEELKASPALFARKFNTEDPAFLSQVLELGGYRQRSTPLVSVILPVYNAEACLQRCIDSLKAQTWPELQFIFIDDASSDASPQILERFSREGGFRCKTVRQERNCGVAAARNRGLQEAEGKYIAFVDADDRICPEAIRKAAEAAEAFEADIVGWDWTLGFEKNGRLMRQAGYASPLQALKNLCGGTMRWNLWLFLLRRSLIEENGIRFLPGRNMGEDMMFMIKAFSQARKTVQLHEPLYEYNAVSTTSLSRQFSRERREEVDANLEEAVQAIASSRYAGPLRDYVPQLKLFIKLPLLISSDSGNYRLWHSWHPEANASAMANKALPLRTRLLQGAAARKCWIPVKAYYLFVYKFVYGVIFK